MFLLQDNVNIYIGAVLFLKSPDRVIFYQVRMIGYFSRDGSACSIPLMKPLYQILTQAVRLQTLGKILVLEEVVMKLEGIRLVATPKRPGILCASVKYLRPRKPGTCMIDQL